MGQTTRFDPKNAMNGTFSYLYINGTEVAELESIKIDDTIGYEKINQPGELRAGEKMMGLEGTGEFVVTKITNKYYKQWAAMIDQGIQPEVVITTVEADPNALESTTIQYLGCTIGNIPYINSAAKTITKDTIKFSFQKREYLEAA